MRQAWPRGSGWAKAGTWADMGCRGVICYAQVLSNNNWSMNIKGLSLNGVVPGVHWRFDPNWAVREVKAVSAGTFRGLCDCRIYSMPKPKRTAANGGPEASNCSDSTFAKLLGTSGLGAEPDPPTGFRAFLGRFSIYLQKFIF